MIKQKQEHTCPHSTGEAVATTVLLERCSYLTSKNSAVLTAFDSERILPRLPLLEHFVGQPFLFAHERPAPLFGWIKRRSILVHNMYPQNLIDTAPREFIGVKGTNIKGFTGHTRLP
jgi:hypothetical protein